MADADVDPYARHRERHWPGRMLFGLALVALIGGLATLALVVANRNANEQSKLTCPGPLAAAADAEATAHDLVLAVDVPANGQAQSARIARQLAPFVLERMEEGARIELALDFGLDSPVMLDTCFDGITTFAAQKENEINQIRLLRDLEGEVERVIRGAVQSHVVSPTGGPARLMASVGRQERSLPLTLIVWSDLLANDGSCLDVTGNTADSQLVEAVARRCDADGVLAFDAAEVHLVGAGASDRSLGFEGWAGELRDRLCEGIDQCQ